MRKYWKLLVILLAAAFLIAGCGGDQGETTGTAGTTVGTEQGGQTTAPLDNQEETQAQDSLLVYEELFRFDINHENWYLVALDCVFDEPQELDLHYYFYNCLGMQTKWSDFSDSEVDYLLQHGFDKEFDVQKRPVEKMDEILQQVFGISFADVEADIPEDWVYYEATDSYYTNYNDGYGSPGNVVGFTAAEECADGTVRVFYSIDYEYYYNTKTGESLDRPDMVVTLRTAEDGSMRIISNQVVD